VRGRDFFAKESSGLFRGERSPDDCSDVKLDVSPLKPTQSSQGWIYLVIGGVVLAVVIAISCCFIFRRPSPNPGPTVTDPDADEENIGETVLRLAKSDVSKSVACAVAIVGVVAAIGYGIWYMDRYVRNFFVGEVSYVEKRPPPAPSPADPEQSDGFLSLWIWYTYRYVRSFFGGEAPVVTNPEQSDGILSWLNPFSWDWSWLNPFTWTWFGNSSTPAVKPGKPEPSDGFLSWLNPFSWDWLYLIPEKLRWLNPSLPEEQF